MRYLNLQIIFLSFLSPIIIYNATQTVESKIIPTNTIAKFAYIIDAQTRVVLLNKNADKRMHPASMTKVMTAYIAFQALKAGVLHLNDQVLISKNASQINGSRMFIEEGKYVSVADLLLGIIVQSGNDASVAIAEYISGDEDSFVMLMNNIAKEIGMIGSNFVNASGWPDDNHYTTAKDLAILAERIIEDFPEYYYLFSQKKFIFNNIEQTNRNDLIGYNGIDGIKTGYTKNSGYGSINSAIIDGRRIIVVINGLESAAKRKTELSRLVNWGFRSTETVSFYSAGDVITDIPLWYGNKNQLKLITNQDILVTKMRLPKNLIRKTVTYNGPISAPIVAGATIGELHIHTDQEIIATFPLKAAESVAVKNYWDCFYSNISYLLWGQIP